MANRVHAQVLNACSSGNNNNKKGNNSSSGAHRLMPVLSVLCDWLEGHAHYLLSCQASLNGLGQEDTALYSDESLIEAEGLSRSTMRQSLCRVVEALRTRTPPQGQQDLMAPPSGGRSATGDASKPLREHIELRLRATC